MLISQYKTNLFHIPRIAADKNFEIAWFGNEIKVAVVKFQIFDTKCKNNFGAFAFFDEDFLESFQFFYRTGDGSNHALVFPITKQETTYISTKMIWGLVFGDVLLFHTRKS